MQQPQPQYFDWKDFNNGILIAEGSDAVNGDFKVSKRRYDPKKYREQIIHQRRAARINAQHQQQ